jgi:hypothetical protein
MTFNQPSSLRPPESFAVASRAMTHDLIATARIGREVPKISCEGYSTDDERRHHGDNSSEHPFNHGLATVLRNTALTLESPTICCAPDCADKRLATIAHARRASLHLKSGPTRFSANGPRHFRVVVSPPERPAKSRHFAHFLRLSAIRS